MEEQKKSTEPMKPTSVKTPSKVYVNNGTSRIGYSIVNMLVQQHKGLFQVCFGHTATMHQERKDQLENLGAKPIQVNMKDKKSICNALKNVRQIVLVGTPTADNVEHMKNAIDAAKESKVLYVLLVSSARADRQSYIWGKQFFEIEQYLENSGLNFTIVRSMFIMQNLLRFTGLLEKSDTFSLPINHGAFAPVDANDLAHAIAMILEDCQQHHGKTYEITGPKVETGQDIATYLSKATGRIITFSSTPYEDALQTMKQLSFTDQKMFGMIGFFRAITEDELTFVEPDFYKITGTKPKSLKQFIGEHASEFQTVEE